MGLMDNFLHTESTRVVSLISGNHCEVTSGKNPMENGHCSSQIKRRKVSAVRDFPPGLVRRAPRINLIPNGEAVGLDAEKAVVSSTDANAANATGALSSGGTLLPETELIVALEPVSSNASKMVNDVDVKSAKDEVTPEKSPLPHDRSDAVLNVCRTNINVTRNYPPRRRVSAVRDFPPLCGRNSSHLGKEEHGEAHTSSKTLGNVQAELEVQAAAETGNDEDCGTSPPNVIEVAEVVDMREKSIVSSPAVIETMKDEDCGTSCANISKVLEVNMEEKSIEPLNVTKKYHFNSVTGAITKSSDLDVGILEENPTRDIVLYTDKGLLDGNCSIFPETNDHFVNQDLEGQQSLSNLDSDGLESRSNLIIVHGLMAARSCPWRQGNGRTPKSAGRTVGRPPKSAGRTVERALKHAGRTVERAPKHAGRTVERNGMVGDLVPLAKPSEQSNQRSHSYLVNLPPAPPLTDKGPRSKVRETLRLFHAVCRKLLQEEEAKSNTESSIKRIDCLAARILKEKNKHVNVGKQLMGCVPGVEVGDEFQYRIELNIIGLHRPTQGGIDYLKQNGEILATSIVASGGYDDNLDSSDVLTYTGQGGLKAGSKEAEDQKLERGNLALMNSIHAKNPVRVIRGETLDTRKAKGSDTRKAKGSDYARKYVYDGLYMVERYWQEMGAHQKLVYKFKLVRIPGQPELAWKVVKKCKKSKVREGLCLDDVSLGKELIPIPAVNTIDDEKPPPFTYITNMMYPDWCRPIPPKGCDCVGVCSESGTCSCVIKNGGEIPYNHNGAIVEAKSLVYECGPLCKCPPSCYNRVTQRGIKFQLEIFKTEFRGWGLRSLNSIPSGGFICEYVGELLEEKEAEKRTGNDEYLFDIGNNYNDSSLWNGLSSLMPDSHPSSCGVVEGVGFTIDAAQYGNIGRFINHSCSPNLYAQNVLFDHEDKRIPHIMLFAVENIPPLQELTYHYNYEVNKVYDSNGNIKKKDCFCGSAECTGRLY